MQVDPADIRFTQDSISLYFQHPYSHFSIRQAVREISEETMSPDEFPPIRVRYYNECLWSTDNRRLWVFRFARCTSISVLLVSKIHPRLKEVISDPGLLCMMEQADFFPKVRDRGQKDWDFDRLYPQPSSINSSIDYDLIYDSGDQEEDEDMGVTAWPKNPPIIGEAQNAPKSQTAIVSLQTRILSAAQYHAKSVNVAPSPHTPPIDTAQDHGKSGNVNASPLILPISITTAHATSWNVNASPLIPPISITMAQNHVKSPAKFGNENAWPLLPSISIATAQDQEKSGNVNASPLIPPITIAQDHANYGNVNASPLIPPIFLTTAQDHAKSGNVNARPLIPPILITTAPPLIPPIFVTTAQDHAKSGNVNARPLIPPILITTAPPLIPTSIRAQDHVMFVASIASPKTPPTSGAHDRVKSGAVTSPTLLDRFVQLIWNAAGKPINNWVASSRLFAGHAVSSARKISSCSCYENLLASIKTIVAWVAVTVSFGKLSSCVGTLIGATASAAWNAINGLWNSAERTFTCVAIRTRIAARKTVNLHGKS
ncbi:unnamed protein product [Calypogeia fissa]